MCNWFNKHPRSLPIYENVENGDVFVGHGFMKSHTISEANNRDSVDSKNKRGENVTNKSGMENSVLQDGVYVDAMLSASTLHQYANMEFNNE